MHQIKTFKRVCSLFLIFGISAIFASSCTPRAVEGLTGITATPITPSPTPRICPPNTNLASLPGLEIDSTFIVVLFDVNSVNSEALEYSDGNTTSDILSFVGKILPEILGPGDQYSMFSLGFQNYESAKLDRYNSKIVNAPEIVATPIPPEILTPIPTPTLSDAVLENQVGKNKHDSEVEAQNATATQSAFDYYCELSVYETTYKVTATAWDVTKQAEANEIATQIVKAQEEREEKIRTIETPFAGENVYEGLSHVTIDFENQCKDYNRCVLIIFDNLEDWRIKTPDYLQVNLEGVEIVSVLPQCQDIIQPSCKEVQDLWTPQFLSSHAKSVQYYNGERLEENLIKYFGDK